MKDFRDNLKVISGIVIDEIMIRKEQERMGVGRYGSSGKFGTDSRSITPTTETRRVKPATDSRSSTPPVHSRKESLAAT
jgi:hypothetical protein